MIKEVTMYTVVCDNCGKDVNQNAEYSCWNDKGFAQDIAIASHWINEDDKHYCPDCFTYDDDDNLVIKTQSGGVIGKRGAQNPSDHMVTGSNPVLTTMSKRYSESLIQDLNIYSS